MSYQANEVLLAELSMLDEMLGDIEPDRVIEREALEARKRKVLGELEEVASVPRFTLTFGGEPVEAGRAIRADFGGTGAALFSEAFAYLDAAMQTPLRASGRLPGKVQRQLRIVGPAVGSFGFMLEAPQPRQPSLPGMPEVTAAEAVVLLLKEARDGNEDGLAELLASLPRPMKKLHDFVAHVAKNRATFSVRFGTLKAATANVEEASQMLDLLRDDQLSIERRTLTGVLTGVLPSNRNFELQLEGEPVKGSLGDAIDPVGLKALVDAQITAEFLVSQYRSRTPRYTMLALLEGDEQSVNDEDASS